MEENTDKTVKNTKKETIKSSVATFFKNIFSKIKDWLVSAFKYMILGIIIFLSFAFGIKCFNKIKEKDTKKKEDIKDNLSSNDESIDKIENNVSNIEDKINEIKEDINTETENINTDVNSFNEKQKEKLKEFGFKKEVKDE